MKKLVSIIIMILTISISLTAFAAESNSANIENMSEENRKILFNSISSAIISSNEQLLIENTAFFETSVYRDVYNYSQNHKLSRSSVNTIVIDYITPDKSSTGDCVALCNCKVDIGNDNNIIFMYEFHINKDGKVYGFNAWQY